MEVVLAVPVKPFDVAKRRLSKVMSPGQRRLASMAMAERILGAAGLAGATPLVLAADREVDAWAGDHRVDSLLDAGSSLDAAAAGAIRWARARGAGWIICHADLPLLRSSDLANAIAIVAKGGSVIAPSTDCGTTLIGSSRDVFEFAYGRASFHLHLGRLEDPVVISSSGLSLDLDGPADLEAATHHTDGRWLADLLASNPL